MTPILTGWQCLAIIVAVFAAYYLIEWLVDGRPSQCNRRTK